MSWRTGARGGAKWYVCDYLISWFMLIVWFHQSLKWCKLVCSLQILSVSRGVIRIQWSLDSDDTTTWNWLWLEGGQLVRILTSQPGNWNGWIFYTHGDGATMPMVLYTYIHPYTTTSVSSVQLWHVAIAAWHLRTIVMCCYNLCEAPSMEEWELRWQIMNNFLLLLLLFHPNRNV